MNHAIFLSAMVLHCSKVLTDRTCFAKMKVHDINHHRKVNRHRPTPPSARPTIQHLRTHR
jgi:hypothetical protein